MTEEPTTNEAEGQSDHILPLEWYIPDDVIRRYATNFTVQATEYEYIVSFFDVSPPLLIGSAEEIQQHLSQLNAVRATCVARIVIAKGRMPGFADIIQRATQASPQSHEEESAE